MQIITMKHTVHMVQSTIKIYNSMSIYYMSFVRLHLANKYKTNHKKVAREVS